MTDKEVQVYEFHGKLTFYVYQTNKDDVLAVYTNDTLIECNIISQFVTYISGCYHHAHDENECPITRKIKNPKWHEEKEKVRMKTQKKKEFSQALGLTYIELYECEFKRQRDENPELRDFIEKSNPQFFKKYQSRRVTMNTILDAVVSDTLFGAVQCDIHVPANLYEHFSEFSPLFVTTTVPFEVIGNTMQTFWKETQTFNGETRAYPAKKMLVGGMRCAKVLLATPLLRYYLEKGLVVTRIYEVVEFSKMKCFSQFVDDITTARRLGDLVEGQDILANMAKLTGYSICICKMCH